MKTVRKKKRSIYGERKTVEELPKYDFLEFGELIGDGHFSRVFVGWYKNDTQVAIKLIERGSKELIENEISLLEELRGSPNIIYLYDVIRDVNTIMIFEVLDGKSTRELFEDITFEQVKFFLKSVFTGISAAHKKNIVHRDLTPGNILVSEDWEQIKIIDWGCGARLSDSMEYKAGSRSFRAPEMLLGDTNYGTGVDIWAIGIIILDILTGGNIPWRAKTTNDTIIYMSQYFGSDDLDEIQDRLGKDVPESVEHKMYQDPIISIESSFDENKLKLADPKLIDLLKKCLTILPEKRITAEEALRHPLFM